ncbi:MAG: DNA-binding protein WhiA [Clostridia bacterium]|nr:DNA-binding protein WhiA [Clostridia bacterium]
MSFSADVKNEIITSIEGNRKQKLSFVLGMLCFGARLIKTQERTRLRFTTENPKIARKLYTLIKNDFSIVAKLTIHKTLKNIMYIVAIDDEKYIEELFYITGLLKRGEAINSFLNFRISSSVIENPACRKAFIKGAFLGGGSVSDPQKNTHLEFVTSHYKLSRDFQKLLNLCEFSPKTVLRKSNYVLYFKNAGEVADILVMLDTFDSLMEYHNVKIMKDMRNNINRKTNCDTANLNKTVEASLIQVRAIEKLKRLGVFDNLPLQLKEIADLRLEYREMSLQELGSMLSSPIGKSGVNHRLRKLVTEAEKYKD